MLTAALIIATIICAIRWWSNYIATRIMMWYLVDKNLPLPTQEDIDRGRKFVVENICNDILREK